MDCSDSIPGLTIKIFSNIKTKINKTGSNIHRYLSYDIYFNLRALAKFLVFEQNFPYILTCKWI